MAWKLTIGGVDRTSLIQKRPHPVRFSVPLNGRATATFTVRPELSVSRFDEVVIYATDGTTKLFGGVILKRKIQAIAPNRGEFLTTCECGDFSTYADWTFATLTYTTNVTMEDVLIDLVDDYLDTFGITLSGSQVTGPSLAPFSWDGKRVSDCLRELCDKSGCVYRIDANKVLSLFVPGSFGSPFSITDADPNCDELTWKDGTHIPYNKVILLCGTGTAVKTAEFTADGSDTSWTTDLPATTDWPLFWLDGTGVPIGPYEPGESGSLWAYQWDPATHTIYQRYGDTAATNGTTLELQYTAQYPFEYEKATGGTPVITAKILKPDIFTADQADDVATGILNQLSQSGNREVTILTREDGLTTGYELDIDIDSRSVDDQFVITNMDVTLLKEDIWQYRVDATEATYYQGSYLDEWRSLTGGTGSSTGLSVVSGAGYGWVEGDVIANRGSSGPLITESSLRGQCAKSVFTGPGLRLGESSDGTERWDIFADMIDGGGASIGPGLIISPIVSSQFTLRLGKYTTGGSHDFVLSKTSSSGQFFIGAPTSFGLSTLGHYVDGIYTDDLSITNGFTERGRTTKAGEYTAIAYSNSTFLGDFTDADWDVASGDQVTYKFSEIGESVTVQFQIIQSSVGSNVNVLQISLPVTVSGNHYNLGIGDDWADPSGMTVPEPIMIAAENGNTYLGLTRLSGADWPSSTNTTLVQGQITFERT